MAKKKFKGSAVQRAGGIMTAVGGGCQILSGQIERMKTLIARAERNLESREADLKKLQSQPKPDTKAITQLTATIAMLQKHLDTDNQTLSQLEDDFSFFCSG